MRIGLRVTQALGRRDKLALLFGDGPHAGGRRPNEPAGWRLGKLVDHMLSTSTRDLMVALPTIGVIAAAILGREALAVARKYIVENTCTRLQKLKDRRSCGAPSPLNLVSMGRTSVRVLFKAGCIGVSRGT